MKAALLTEINQPLVLAEVEPDVLAPGQVLCQVLVSGICGKQLGEIKGVYDSNAPLPRILGHEACVIVEEVGPGVTKLKKGDKAVAHWRKSSGMDATFPKYISAFVGGVFTSGRIATFAEQTIISENRLTPVPHETPNELAALLGCGLSTALGVMENEARLKAGESVLIVGCGGVGLNLIRVAKMMGASNIVGTDVNNKEAASVLAGAQHFVRFFPQFHVYGDRFDVIVDTTGNVDAIEAALLLLAPSGRLIMVGQPREGEEVHLLNARHLFDGEGKTIKATQGGGFNPDRDIPRFLAMWKSGHLRIDGIITHRYPFSQVNEALDAVRSGSAGRAILEMI